MFFRKLCLSFTKDESFHLKNVLCLFFDTKIILLSVCFQRFISVSFMIQVFLFRSFIMVFLIWYFIYTARIVHSYFLFQGSMFVLKSFTVFPQNLNSLRYLELYHIVSKRPKVAKCALDKYIRDSIQINSIHNFRALYKIQCISIVNKTFKILKT